MNHQWHHQKKLIYYCLGVYLFSFFLGCETSPPIMPSTCNFIPSNARPPKWVLGDNALDGYYVGIGQAEKKHADIEPDAFIKQARLNALENLAQNIQVKVKSAFKMKRIHSDDNNRITFSENIQSDLSTHTDLTIFNILQDGLWLDQKKCIVWMRIKVKQSLVDNLFLISQAESNFKKANDSNLSLKDRIQKIETGIDQIQSVDFSSVPSRGKDSTYLKKYRALQSNLKTQLAGRQLIYVVQAPDIIHQSVTDALVSRLMNAHQGISAWYEKDIDCPNIDVCLDMARTNQAVYLANIQFKTKISKQDMGFIEGYLTIVLSLYDVQTGQLKFQDTSDPMKSLSYDENHMPWGKVVNALWGDNWFLSYIESLPK